MSIILRTLKGSALTYDEMDRNLSQYFYSSSVHDSGAELRLHYTGSDNLDTVEEVYGPDRYHSVALGSGGAGSSLSVSVGNNIARNVTLLQFTGGASLSPAGPGIATVNITGAGGTSPGGSNSSIQFNDSSTFGGDTKFVYNKSNYLLGIGEGIGTPSARLHIVGDDKASAIVRLATSGGDSNQPRVAKLTFFDGSTQLGEVGKTSADSNNLFLTAVNKLNFNVGLEDLSTTIATVTSTGLGIGRETPNRPLVVVGDGGIGIQKDAGEIQSILQPIPTAITSGNDVLPAAERRGLFISPPEVNDNETTQGGHVVVSLASNVGTNSFSIITSPSNVYSSATSVATFRANKRVGIALANGDNPQTALHVNGQIKAAYYEYDVDVAALSLDTIKVSKVSYTVNNTITSATGASGTTAVLILSRGSGDNAEPVTISFGSNFYIQTPGHIEPSTNTTYTMSFVSDGTHWYETSRTAALLTPGVLL